MRKSKNGNDFKVDSSRVVTVNVIYRLGRKMQMVSALFPFFFKMKTIISEETALFSVR